MTSALSGSEVLSQITRWTHISRNDSGLLGIPFKVVGNREAVHQVLQNAGIMAHEQEPIPEVMGFGHWLV